MFILGEYGGARLDLGGRGEHVRPQPVRAAHPRQTGSDPGLELLTRESGPRHVLLNLTDQGETSIAEQDWVIQVRR